MSLEADSIQIRQLTHLQRLLIGFGSFLIRGLCLTLRYKVTDEPGFFTGSAPGPVVILIWHNRILGAPIVFERRYPKRKGLYVLTSASRDGAYLSEIAGRFGMHSVRGSSSRRGAIALLDLFRTIRQGFDLCITPDGPRGPRYKLGSGAVLVSQRCSAPLMPIYIEYSSCWRLKSWDGFMIPKPFSKVVMTLMPYVNIPKTDTEEAFEAERAKVEMVMTERLVMR
jgi:lysophospholipid acyltransferase (LPLAT)-like uncharacterized protein